MLAGMMLRGLVGMMRRVQAVSMREMRVMTCFMMIAGVIVLGGLAMMMCGVIMMLCRRIMMLGTLVLCAHVLRSLSDTLVSMERGLLFFSDDRMTRR